MRKLFVCVLMLTAVVVLSTPTHSGALAQATKKDKDTKKSTRGGTPLIEINEGKDGKFRFVIRAGDGKLLAMSGPTGFASEKDAGKAIEELKEVIGKARVTTGKKKGK